MKINRSDNPDYSLARDWLRRDLYNSIEYKKWVISKVISEPISLSKPKLKIELQDWDSTCADGCCYNSGTMLILNGEQLEHPDENQFDNRYLGSDLETGLLAVLKKLGYTVEIEKTYK